MSKFDELLKSVSEDVTGIKFRSPREHGSENETAGHPPGDEGYDTENVDYSETSSDLETEIKDLIMNSHKYAPSIIEDEEAIQDAIREFLGKIGYTQEEAEEKEEEDTEDFS